MIMDVLYFFQDRLKFLKNHYNTSVLPFAEIIRQIEAHEAPYVPYYDESGEPPYLEEWIEAQTSINEHGLDGIAKLSNALKLYFQTWETLLGRSEWRQSRAFKNGFIYGYIKCLEQSFEIDFAECPADVAILEQIILARNTGQHPDTITTMDVRHTEKALEKFPSPFFANASELNLVCDGEGSFAGLIPPRVEIDLCKLLEAIAHAELLTAWLEKKLQKIRWPNS